MSEQRHTIKFDKFFSPIWFLILIIDISPLNSIAIADASFRQLVSLRINVSTFSISSKEFATNSSASTSFRIFRHKNQNKRQGRLLKYRRRSRRKDFDEDWGKKNRKKDEKKEEKERVFAETVSSRNRDDGTQDCTRKNDKNKESVEGCFKYVHSPKCWIYRAFESAASEYHLFQEPQLPLPSISL